jgi:hypothetical protein
VRGGLGGWGVSSRKLIAIHPCATGYICFDIFCPKSEIPEELDGFGYRVEHCPVVKKIGVEDYVCSEDLAHPPWFNLEVMKTIVKLIKMGFEVEFIELEAGDEE